jgi:hypothetical protein
MYWIVRADTFWYKFDDLEEARNHFNYVYENRNEKYKNIDKIYLAEYDEFNSARILEIWRREKQEEKCYEK